jgi:hypothetical protein
MRDAGGPRFSQNCSSHRAIPYITQQMLVDNSMLYKNLDGLITHHP